MGGGDRGTVDGEGDVMCFFGEEGTVAHLILIEACDDAVAILCNALVKVALGALKPVGNHRMHKGIIAQLWTEVEVGIAERLAIHSHFHPVVVDAKGSKKDMSVVAAQVAVEGPDAFSAQVEEYGVDELNDVVASQAGEYAGELSQIVDCRKFRAYGAALQVDVSRIVLPTVTVGDNGDFMPECT